MLMALKQVLLESVFIFLQCVVWMLVVFISSLITPCVDLPVSSVSGHRDNAVVVVGATFAKTTGSLAIFLKEATTNNTGEKA